MLSLEFLPSYSLSTLFLHATLTTREQEILLSSLLYLSFSSSTTKLKESVGTGLMTTSVCQSRSAFKIDGRFYAGKTINLQICKYKYRYFCNFVYLVLFDTPPPPSTLHWYYFGSRAKGLQISLLLYGSC